MPKDYGTHKEFMKEVSEIALQRAKKVETALRNAFKEKIKLETAEFIPFSEVSAMDLANAIYSSPVILKPLLGVCNIAARAIERDLQIKNLDTYRDGISQENSKIIAGYIKPFLPPLVPILALVHVDRVEFIDKEIRKRKGRWEKRILNALQKSSKKDFVKRKFKIKNQTFELDAAYPLTGDILLGIDVKRMEARRDIHKRCDEILNKAAKLKEAYPKAKFGAVIYYPFVEEHANVQDRLRSDFIDSVVFASELDESITNAVKLLLSKVDFK